MWKAMADRLPDAKVLLYALMTGIIPWCVYIVNQRLHRRGDPPWKREP